MKRSILALAGLLACLVIIACSERTELPLEVPSSMGNALEKQIPALGSPAQNLGQKHNEILADIHRVIPFPYDPRLPVDTLIRTTRDALIHHGAFDPEIWQEVLRVLPTDNWEHPTGLPPAQQEYFQAMVRCWDSGRTYEEKRQRLLEHGEDWGLPRPGTPLAAGWDVFLATSQYWEAVDTDRGWAQIGRDDIIGGTTGARIGGIFGRPFVGGLIGAVAGSAFRMAVAGGERGPLLDASTIHDDICREVLAQHPLGSSPTRREILDAVLRIGAGYDPGCGDYFHAGMDQLRAGSLDLSWLEPRDRSWWDEMLRRSRDASDLADFRSRVFSHCLEFGLPDPSSPLSGALDVYLGSADLWSRELPERGFWDRVTNAAMYDATGFLQGARFGMPFGRPVIGGAIVGAGYSTIEIFQL